MSDESRRLAGILLITVPAVAFGGVTLLRMIYRHEPGYLDNPVRQDLWRAGHAHAGVLIVFALVGLLYVDQAGLSGWLEGIVRYGFAAAPIIMPLGFFLSIASPGASRANRLILLVPAGGIALSVAALVLGIGLVAA